MSLNVNRMMIAGNLTADPRVTFLTGNPQRGDNVVASFTVANNRRYKGSDGIAKEETTYMPVECWGRQAELVGQYLQKGSGVFVDGRVKMDCWEDAKTKEKRSRIVLVGQDITFLERPRNTQETQGAIQDEDEGAIAPAATTATTAATAINGAIPPTDAPRVRRARPAPAASAVPSNSDDEPPF